MFLLVFPVSLFREPWPVPAPLGGFRGLGFRGLGFGV